jgi:predicted secreted hydrolase
MRRRLVAWCMVYCAGVTALRAEPPPMQSPHPAVVSGKPMVFPADYGSHPDFRTEWWYVTGWLTPSGSDRGGQPPGGVPRGGQPLGFQITFFRTKPDVAGDNPSAFSPRQILIAHCAISDPTRGRLWQDQRIRRAGMGLAAAAVGDTAVYIEGWSLQRGAGGYSAKIDAEEFSLDLKFEETQAMMQNGEAGFSRKGPAADAASYYYSLPHLRVSGRITRRAETNAVSGEAWLDHEWSSQYLDEQAVGWDWIGINLDDGAALMAFRIRDARGHARWAGGTLRGADGHVQILQPGDVEFQPAAPWTSPRTGIVYPLQWSVRAGTRTLLLKPLLEDQENDTRLTTGAIYWEGAVRAYEHGEQTGRGYLELTGYGERLRLR